MPNINKRWSDDQIKAVWSKGKMVSGYDPNEYRQDVAGAWMRYSEYGNTAHELGLGWEIDHCKPESKGGEDELPNLRPLQWANNRTKGDDYPQWSSAISSDGNQNIKKVQSWIER